MINKHNILPFLVLVMTSIGFPVFGQASAREFYAMGRQLQLEEKYYEAVETYKLSLIENRHYLDPMIGLAESFFALGEFSEALMWIEKAEIYDRNRTDLKNLKGRILISLGEYENGQILFQEVLQVEPNNLHANFGMAELEIAEGKIAKGTRMFEDTLAMAPDNRKALLTLTILYDAMGKPEKAEEYLRQALHYHYEDVYTQLLAARHYSQVGRLDLAEMHAKTALGIRRDFPDVTRLLGNLYLGTARNEEAAEFLKKSISINRNDNLLWYALGLAQERSGNLEESITSYSRALQMKPDDEITRIKLEQLLSSRLDMETPARARFSMYHLQRGKEFEERNLYSKALAEYRRALKIAPLSEETRLAYADIFLRMGFPAKYLSELYVLKEQHDINSEIEDAIEIQSSLQEDSLARRWAIDQFSAETMKYEYSLAVFVYPDQGIIEHYDGEKVLVQFLSDLLFHFENIRVEHTGTISAFSEGFRTAREKGTDYFLILYPEESERIFNVRGELYISDTGGAVREYSVMRTGNDKVANAMVKLVEQVQADLVPTGQLLQRKFDTALINLGTMEGVEKGQTFNIVKRGSAELNSNDLGFFYPEDAVIGTLVISETDERVSLGVVQPSGFFDMINIGDQVFLSVDEESTEPEEPPAEKRSKRKVEEVPEPQFSPYPPIRLYEQIIRIQ